MGALDEPLQHLERLRNQMPPFKAESVDDDNLVAAERLRNAFVGLFGAGSPQVVVANKALLMACETFIETYPA